MRRRIDFNRIVVEDTKTVLEKATEYKRYMQEAVPMAMPPAIVQPAVKAPLKMTQGPSSKVNPSQIRSMSTQATGNFVGNAPKPGIAQVKPDLPKSAITTQQPPNAGSPASKVASGVLGTAARVAGGAATGAALSTAARDAAFSSPENRQVGKDLYKNSPVARAVSDTMLKAREAIGLPSTAPKEFQRTSSSSAAPAPAPTTSSSTPPSAATKPGKPGVVSKADLDTYRRNVGNKNATLGQYMNDLQNKTAKVGGKNDPASIQSRMKSGQKAFDPTTTTGQFGGPKSSSSAAPNPPPRPENIKPPTQNPDQNITKQVPTIKAPETPNKIPASGSAGAPGASIGGGVGGAGGAAGTGPGAGSGGSGGAGIGPGSRGGRGGQGGSTTNEGVLGECVQVNGNRYRII